MTHQPVTAITPPFHQLPWNCRALELASAFLKTFYIFVPFFSFPSVRLFFAVRRKEAISAALTDIVKIVATDETAKYTCHYYSIYMC